MMKYTVIFWWIVCGIVAAGLFNADLTHDGYHWSSKARCERMMAQVQGMTLGWGIAAGPIGLVIATFASGFGYSGWQITRTKCEGYDERP